MNDLENSSNINYPNYRSAQQSVHLFVFVHGFQANSQDMYLLKATLLNLLPESVVMLSSANEGKTESSIN